MLAVSGLASRRCVGESGSTSDRKVHAGKRAVLLAFRRRGPLVMVACRTAVSGGSYLQEAAKSKRRTAGASSVLW